MTYLLNVIESRGIKLKKKGKNYVGLCPFHKDTTPSFTVNPAKQLWNCFGCSSNGNGSTGGDVIGFIVKYDNISFREAVEKLKGQVSRTISISSVKAPEKTKPLTPKQQKLLNRVIQYYQASLLKDTSGLEYLQKNGAVWTDRISLILALALPLEIC